MWKLTCSYVITFSCRALLIISPFFPPEGGTSAVTLAPGGLAAASVPDEKEPFSKVFSQSIGKRLPWIPGLNRLHVEAAGWETMDETCQTFRARGC